MNTDMYNCTFPVLIDDWRKAFHEGSDGQTNKQFPFGFVQVSVRWKCTPGQGYLGSFKSVPLNVDVMLFKMKNLPI